MGAHIINGTFQLDKYPTCPAGKVPLSVKDATAQDLLWEYAKRRRSVDAEFSDDLEVALRAAGYEPSRSMPYEPANAGNVAAVLQRYACWIVQQDEECRAALAEELNRHLDELLRGDAFGTEGQCDPRGDHRE